MCGALKPSSQVLLKHLSERINTLISHVESTGLGKEYPGMTVLLYKVEGAKLALDEQLIVNGEMPEPDGTFRASKIGASDGEQQADSHPSMAHSGPRRTTTSRKRRS